MGVLQLHRIVSSGYVEWKDLIKPDTTHPMNANNTLIIKFDSQNPRVYPISLLC